MNKDEVQKTEVTLLEETASIIHDTWMSWASTLLEGENISQDRKERWAKYMVPYEDLTEEVKEEDRKIARLHIHKWKVIEVENLRQNGIISSIVYEDLKERIKNERNRVFNSDSGE